MKVIPSEAVLGAEIVGVDLTQALDACTCDAIEAAYNEHLVVVLRDQRLSPEQLLRFARRLGTLEVSPCAQFASPDYKEILILSNILDPSGKPIGNADAGQTWHTDMSYTATPPRGTVLHAVEVPHDTHGVALGDTLFASTAAAYEALPLEMQKRLHGRRAIHRAGAKQYAPGSKLAAAIQDMPDVTHPVIRTHPVTGRKAIYVREGECIGIVDMPDAEARALIRELSDFVIRPEFRYRHKWCVGDLLMWDNCCVQHLAVKDYNLPQRRLMYRVTLNGSIPV
jgi:taurine dioxygenase